MDIKGIKDKFKHRSDECEVEYLIFLIDGYEAALNKIQEDALEAEKTATKMSHECRENEITASYYRGSSFYARLVQDSVTEKIKSLQN